MSIMLRFVNKNRYVKERFFSLVHVKGTIALTLKDEIPFVLSQHNLDIQSIRGQGYDSAIAASKKVISIHNFFTKLNSIINIVGVLCKRTDQLKIAHAENIAHLLAIDELQSGKRLNQIGILQRSANMRWSSHLKSVSSIMNMFGVICEVLLHIIDDGVTSAQHGEADLQSQDILNAMHLVLLTKSLIQKLRDEGWDDLITKVISFCKLVNIYAPNLNAFYVARRERARYQQDEITIEYHYRIDIFNAVINSQLQELNNKFNYHIVELLSLSSVLDPKEMHASFKTNDICKMVEKFYPQDFVEYEMVQLRVQFEHFDHVRQLFEFGALSTISDLCQWLMKTRKFEIYPLLYRVATLIFTLPVFTVTTERSFSNGSL
ncbi:uncharacterized protein LOC122723268 [Manihot esculenta]|uniref:uncharacterized protein LOC122723268 n=1 Tax=Manihot esculenta TaxID=3983 RepID=UPI001CC740B4|nr:uncharacterized protein LOC122723268 [Manihot esculenta]